MMAIDLCCTFTRAFYVSTFEMVFNWIWITLEVFVHFQSQIQLDNVVMNEWHIRCLYI
jgi:hypothetical protein